MSPEDAERLAIPFGLTYLSREGYAKLAELLDHAIATMQPQPVEYQRLWEIVKAPTERWPPG